MLDGDTFMDIKINDILTMKKNHPCGGNRFVVLRVGMDFRLECLSCGHSLMSPRVKLEKNIKSVERTTEKDKGNNYV